MNYSIFNDVRVHGHACVHKCAGVLSHQRYWAVVNCPTRYWEAKLRLLLIFQKALQPLALNN